MKEKKSPIKNKDLPEVSGGGKELDVLPAMSRAQFQKEVRAAVIEALGEIIGSTAMPDGSEEVGAMSSPTKVIADTVVVPVKGVADDKFVRDADKKIDADKDKKDKQTHDAKNDRDAKHRTDNKNRKDAKNGVVIAGTSEARDDLIDALIETLESFRSR